MIKNKLAVVIPTRGNRERFLDFSLKRLNEQTLKPDEIIIVNDKPRSNNKDIAWRYKVGLQRAKEKKCNAVIFWEDDDWYSIDYIEWLYKKWIEYNSPFLFGIDETYYYHIRVNKYNYMKHPQRSSAFCMIVNPSEVLKCNWPKDDYPFLDLHLWRNHKGTAISFGDRVRAIGIKHGIGMVGGGGHNINFKWTNHKAYDWFINIIDKESLNFYNSIEWK